MGSFVPNALSFHPDSNGHDVSAPLYIYETQTLGLDAVSQEGPMVLELKLQSTEGAIYSDFFYLFVQEKEGAAGVGNGRNFIETTVMTPRSQGIEPRSLVSNGSAGGENRRRLVAGVHNNDSAASSIGSHENEHHKERGEWDMTEDELGEEEEEAEEAEGDDFDEKPIGIKDKKKSHGGGRGSGEPVEPDAGEHLMQATSQFFSKMG